MTKHPNTFQKWIHRILMMRFVSAVLAVILPYADKFVSALTSHKHTVTELVGLPVIYLTTIGAKSGRERTIPLVSLFDGEKIALIGSNFGRKNNPGWYYNLKANPRCSVRINNRTAAYIARQAEGEEREKYWAMAVPYYGGYEKYKERAAHRVIPIMILEPVK